MSRYTIPYRELPPRPPRVASTVRRIGKIIGWAVGLTGVALFCALFSR